MSDKYITEPTTNGKVCLQTSMGDVDIELWSKEAPKACRNFVQLAMEGYYNKCLFHTVIKDCIVQTGDPTGTGEGGESIYGEDFPIEVHQRLRFNRRGLVAMAAKDGYNSSQFFITLGTTPELNGKHTLFGKITGNTIFNLLTINETEVDSSNRPVRSEKITGVRILSNPFNDIVPRKLEKEKKKPKKEKKEVKVQSNTALLSFGDEMDDDELMIAPVKGKSAHDILEDSKLSKALAVNPEEMGVVSSSQKSDDDDEKKSTKLSKVREKLMSKGKKTAVNEEEERMEMDDVLEEHRGKERDEEREKLAAEVKALSKEYMKAVRGPKTATNPEDDTKLSAGMKGYKSMKLKFKSKSSNVVDSTDPQREYQTMKLLERFQTTMGRASVQGILSNKKVDISDQKTSEELIREGAIPRKRKLPADMIEEKVDEIDDDAVAEMDAKEEEEIARQTKAIFDETVEDEVSTEWAKKKFVGIEDLSGVTKARDANLREEDEEWYAIDDPRNKMNIRKRMGETQ